MRKVKEALRVKWKGQQASSNISRILRLPPARAKCHHLSEGAFRLKIFTKRYLDQIQSARYLLLVIQDRKRRPRGRIFRRWRLRQIIAKHPRFCYDEWPLWTESHGNRSLSPRSGHRQSLCRNRHMKLAEFYSQNAQKSPD